MATSRFLSFPLTKKCLKAVLLFSDRRCSEKEIVLNTVET